MQKFNPPMSAEDRIVARRVTILMAIIYASGVLAITAGVVGSNASRNVAAKVPVIVQDQVSTYSRTMAPGD